MSQVVFTIDHKDYPIGCPDSQKERLEKLANLVKQKESEVVEIMGANISHEMLLVMIIVAVLDELDRLKSKELFSATLDLAPLENDLKEIIQFAKILKDSLQ